MIKKVGIITFSLAAAVILSLCSGPVLAQKYGEGTYGTAEYNNNVTPTPTPVSSGSSNSSSSTTSTPTCETTPPGYRAVWLYAAIPQSSGSIELYFTEAQEPYDHYALEYGTESGNYRYGAVDIGKKGIRTYLVQFLLPNTTYYFRIRSGNGCATGPWSNEISATTKNLISTGLLEISSSELKPRDKVATEEVNGNNNASQSQNNTDAQQKHTGYDVNVRVMDNQQKPVKGAEVTLHSTPRRAITDAKGVASFTGVEAGQHQVLIAYDGYEGEQTVNLQGDVKALNLTVTVQRKAIALSKLAWIIIGILSAIAVVLGVLLYKSKRNRIKP